MRGQRLRNQLQFFLINDPYKRGDFLREKGLFHKVGKNVSYQPRKIPLYGELIEIGDNVCVGSGVIFCTHDGMGAVFSQAGHKINEKAGCIRIGSNCFIGANAILLYDTEIGDDCVIAAGAVVNKDVLSGSVVGGVPGRVIGSTVGMIEKYKGNQKFDVDKEKISIKCVELFWKWFDQERKGENRKID